MFKMLKNLLDTKKFDIYSKEINIRNYKSFRIFMVTGSIISLVVLLCGILFSKYMQFNVALGTIFLYFILLLIISKRILENHIEHMTSIFYTSITPIMLMGIMLGTFLDKYKASITIMVFLCALTIFILDKPIRILLYLSFISVVYCICCYYAKTYDLFAVDFIHLIIFYLIAVGVNFFTLNDRIESVENNVKYKEKSEMDLLTNIYNRETGIDKIKSLISKKITGAFIIIDIDDFKYINDTYGHICGDKALEMISATIKNCFKKEDIVLRLGGDEFAIYVVGLKTKAECDAYCKMFFDELKYIQGKKDYTYNFGVSLGCSVFNESIKDFNELYENSDKCLYEAKKLGKGCYFVDD